MDKKPSPLSREERGSQLSWMHTNDAEEVRLEPTMFGLLLERDGGGGRELFVATAHVLSANHVKYLLASCLKLQARNS